MNELLAGSIPYVTVTILPLLRKAIQSLLEESFLFLCGDISYGYTMYFDHIYLLTKASESRHEEYSTSDLFVQVSGT
jgi:hypothetical protein